MSEQNDSKIRELLKKSRALTPPESFYRGVLEKIEKKAGRVEERTPWYWGYSAKALATACILMIVVIVTRETKKSQPELFQKNTPPADLSNLKEVQSRVNNSISGYVNNPSPFEEVDKEARKELASSRQIQSKAKPGSEPITQTHAAFVMQARDTVTGVASQESFSQPTSLVEKKVGGIRAKAVSLQDQVSNTPSLAGGGGLVNRATVNSGGGTMAASPVSEVPSAAGKADMQLAASTNEVPLDKAKQKGFEITGPITERNILQKTLPVYPASALDQGLQGTVRLYIRVTPEGTVSPQIRITQTTGYPDLDKAAVDAVKKWQFSPAPENSWGIITFQFTPNN